MRSFFVGGVAALVACTSVSHAAPSVKVRRAEVIVMTSAQPARTAKPIQPEPPSGSAKPVAARAVAAPFRTHDLSRKWVRFEMANSFASATDVPAGANGDLFGGRDIAPSDASGISPTVAPLGIAVPAWMQTRLPFSSAVTSSASGCAGHAYRPAGFLDAAAEIRRFGYYPLMGAIACQYGIPVGLFDALIIRESRYNAGIFSPKNAYGLTQLMPGTAAGLGVDRYDAEQNLRGGARYLRQQLDRFGHVHLALAAYNAGPARIRDGTVPRIAETQAYVDNVLSTWRRLAGFHGTAVVWEAASPAPLRMPPAGRKASVSSF